MNNNINKNKIKNYIQNNHTYLGNIIITYLSFLKYIILIRILFNLLFLLLFPYLKLITYI